VPETLLEKGRMFSTYHLNYNNSILFEPLKKVSQSFYECGKYFVLDPILEMYKKENTLGIVIITGKEFLIYKIIKTGNHYDKKKIFSKTISALKRHKKGGSSAARYGRCTDAKEEAYIKLIGNQVAKSFMENNNTECSIEKLIIAGPSEKKNMLCQDPIVQQYFKNNIIMMNMDNVNDKTIFELIDKTKSIFEENKNSYEDAILEEIRELMMQASEKLVYGFIEVLKLLKTNELKQIITDKESAKLFKDSNCEVIIISSHKLKVMGINVIGLRFF
jgi:peptide chain release factor subunit 1